MDAMLMRALPSNEATAECPTVAKKKMGVFFKNLLNEKRLLKQYCGTAVQVTRLLNQNTTEMFQTLVIPKHFFSQKKTPAVSY